MTDAVPVALALAAVPGWLLFAWWPTGTNDDRLEDGIVMGALGYAVLLVFAAIITWAMIHVRVA